MTRQFLLSILLFLILSSCGNKPQVQVPQHGHQRVVTQQKVNKPLKSGLKNGIAITKVGKTAYDDLRGIDGDTIYYSTYKGKIEYEDTLTHTRHEVANLKLIFLLNKLYIIPIKKDNWFMFWEETDYEGMKTCAAVFNAKEKQPIWKVRFLSPNPSVPVIDGTSAYFATLGMVAKINLSDGQIIWKMDSLFNQSKLSFQNFEKPLIYEDKVIFVDLPVPGRREYRDSLILDPQTGVRKK